MKSESEMDLWRGLVGSVNRTTLAHIEAVFGLLGQKCHTILGAGNWFSFSTFCTLAFDEDLTPEEIAIESRLAIMNHALVMMRAFYVNPHLSLAFTYIGYAIWLKSNGWDMEDVECFQEYVFTHPTHGRHIFTGAMAHSFMERL
jgi:hypothetical protein